MKEKGSFKATDRANQLVPSEVDVEGTLFKVKRSGKALKEIIRMNPEDNTELDADQNIDLLYKGIAVVLVDAEGKHPDPEWLEDNLDFEVAQELMEAFVPRRAEEEASATTNSNGEPSTVTTTP